MGDAADKATLFTKSGGALGDGALLSAGDVVAGYRIVSVAGVGGMGVVYRAVDPDLGRPVALKLIAPARAADARIRRLFIRESLSAAALEHPHVIPIYRAGEDAGHLYIAMRFVEGASLQELIEAQGRLPAGRAARIIARVAEALDAAHAMGLVHRDVKPANILIADPDGDEHVYLTDFGLATADTGQPGHWVGTPAYLAPEQISGDRLDARTDVYALGCVLFHALSGHPPFQVTDEVAAFDAHIQRRPPRISEVAPDVPPHLDDVISRALAKRPEDRFQSAGAFAQAALAARFDVAICAHEDDRAAADRLATELRQRDAAPVVAIGAGAREAVRSSGGCVVMVGRSGLGQWARDPLAAAHDLATRDRAFRIVTALLPDGPDPLDTSLAFLGAHPWADLRGGVADSAEDLLRALRGAAPGRLGDVSTEVSPYRGLEPFDEEHADDFFGRESEAGKVLQHLRLGRFLAVVGPSGSGKSSLVRAGVLPQVRRGGVPGGARWRVLDMTPGEHPCATLAARLAEISGAGSPAAADLAGSESRLDEALAASLDGRPDDERVLIIVDQLEEAFTLADQGERDAFLANLAYAATIPGGRSVVIVTLRADFYHRLSEHAAMRALVAAQQHALGPMDAAALRRAIEQPARRAGLGLEPGLTRRILTDVSGRPGTLPLLEHLLLELWQRRSGNTLTLEAYGASGGVEGSLARRANVTYAALSTDQQVIARRILLRLTQPGEGTEDTRRRSTLGELVTHVAERPDVEAVVSSLVGARLLSSGSDEITGEPTVEVTHEALIRGWPELRAWIDDDREALRLQRRLTDAAHEWDRAGRDDGLLYRGTRLGLWDGRDLTSLNEVERAFLAAGRARAESEYAVRRRRVRVAIGALSVAVAVVGGVAAFGFVQRGNATDQQKIAESRQIAASSREQLPADPEIALLLAREAYGQAPTAQAESALRQATAASRARFALHLHEGPINGMSLSGDGHIAATGGDDGTIRVFDPRKPSDPKPQTLLTGKSPVTAVSVSKDGSLLAAGTADGTLLVWDLPAGSGPRSVHLGKQPIRSIAATIDGATLVVAGDDGAIRLLGHRGQDPSRTLTTIGGPVHSVDISDDGSRVMSGSGDPTTQSGFDAKIWDVRTRTAVATQEFTGPVRAVLLDDQHAIAIAASSDQQVIVQALRGSAPPVTFDTHSAGQTSVTSSPDGRLIVSGGSDGALRLWRATGGPVIVKIPGHSAVVTAVSFVPGTQLIVSAGEDGSVRFSDGQVADTRILDREYAVVARIIGDTSTAEVIPVTGDVRRLDLVSGREDVTRPPPPGAFFWAAMNSAGDSVISLSGRTGIVTRHGRSVTRSFPTEGVLLAVSENGRWLAWGDLAGSIALYDLDASTEKGVLSVHETDPLSVAVSSSGALAIGLPHGTVRVWASPTATSSTLQAGTQSVTSVAFSSDGARLAAGTRGGEITVAPVSGSRRITSLSQNGVVQSLAFTDGDRLLVAGGENSTVWDWANGELITQRATTGAIDAEFDPIHGTLLVAGSAGTAEYTCETCGPISQVRGLSDARVTRALTAAERRSLINQ